MVEDLEDGVVTEPETVARYYRTMGRETDRLAGLVDDLFELSRIQAGALHLELEKIALDEPVSDGVVGVSLAVATPSVHLRVVASPTPVGELSIPAMARVVRNLLAVGRALVEAHRGDITVKDEGQGCRFTVRLPLA